MSEFNPHSLGEDEFLEEVHSVDFWFQAVDGYLSDRSYGRIEGVSHPEIVAPERESLITTLCNYCVGETAALEASSGLVAIAPNRNSKIFLATQVVDEARHLEVFIRRLRDLGVTNPEFEIAKRANPSLVKFKDRLLELVEGHDWDAAVFAQNVVLETMEYTAFRAHMKVADPATAEVLDGVVKDERRHLGFGENDLGRRLMAMPEKRANLAEIRVELDTLVLATFEGVQESVGVDRANSVDLGSEYLDAIERLGLT